MWPRLAEILHSWPEDIQREMPFDNNFTERSTCPAVILRKNSYEN